MYWKQRTTENWQRAKRKEVSFLKQRVQLILIQPLATRCYPKCFQALLCIQITWGILLRCSFRFGKSGERTEILLPDDADATNPWTTYWVAKYLRLNLLRSVKSPQTNRCSTFGRFKVKEEPGLWSISESGSLSVHWLSSPLAGPITEWIWWRWYPNFHFNFISLIFWLYNLRQIIQSSEPELSKTVMTT